MPCLLPQGGLLVSPAPATGGTKSFSSLNSILKVREALSTIKRKIDVNVSDLSVTLKR